MNMLEVIYRGAYGLSDDARDNEYGCQERLAKAIYEMEQAIKMAAEDSVLPEIRATCKRAQAEFADFIHDNVPDARVWDEAIERARS